MRGSVFGERWRLKGRDSYVSGLLYIHSKVMIVDDRVVIVGVGLMSCL